MFLILLITATTFFTSGHCAFKTECASYCLNLMILYQPHNLTCPSQIVECDNSTGTLNNATTTTSTTTTAIRWCLTVYGVQYVTASICYTSSGGMDRKLGTLTAADDSLIAELEMVEVSEAGGLWVPVEIQENILDINCSIAIQGSHEFNRSYHIPRREYIYDVILPNYPPHLLRHPAPTEVIATGGSRMLCVHGKAADASITWKINASPVNSTYTFPHPNRLSRINEFCLENPFKERSCDCLMSELQRLDVTFQVPSLTKNSFGVFSTNFAYSNSETTLKSIGCSGVANHFVSILVISNASFPVPQSAAVEVINSANGLHQTQHFQIKTEYLQIEDTVSSPVGEVAELPEGVTGWLLCVHTVSIGTAGIQWTSVEERDILYFNLTSPKAPVSIDGDFNSTVEDICHNHRNLIGSVLVVGIPEEVIHSEQHDGAYLSFQQSLLVFCNAQRRMSGIYSCGDNSAQVRRVHVCIDSCSPHAPLTDQAPLSGDIDTATISLVVLLGAASVLCMVTTVLTSVVFWRHRKRKNALHELQQIQLVHSTALTIENLHTSQE